MEYNFKYSDTHTYFKDATGPKENGASNSSRSGSASFSYSDSFEETCARYTKGYPKGTGLAKELSLQLTPFLRTVRGMKRGFTPQRYAGGNFILSNYVRGIPEVCSVMSPIVSKKFASIIVNNTASCGVEAETLLRRGVVTLALADILQSNGYRTSIKVCFATGAGKNKLSCIIDVKPFHQTPDLDRLAFFLADPSAFRRLFFSFLETKLDARARRNMQVDGGTYGHPVELPKTEIGDKDIYLGCQDWHNQAWHTTDGAIAWIKETLKRYGIVFHG
jgi:hypothetical protein